MRPGTPGFVGARLREAREARGLNGIAFADLIGVTRQSVSQYESGQQTPAPRIMQVICEKLDLPMHFFLRDSLAADDATIFYRSLSTATKAQRCRAERRFGWLREIVFYLRKFIEFPKVDFPEIAKSNPEAVSDNDIEQYATAARRHWGLGDGPISNLAWLLENKGAVVARHEIGAAKLDAFSQWGSKDETPYFVLGDDKSSAARSRYDAAHELAHMLMHRHLSRGEINKPVTFKTIELQAHRFAGAFLLPETSFSAEFCGASLDRLVALKSRWRVSVACMIHRAKDLELLPERQYRRLCFNLSRRGWRTCEPLDDQLAAEEPRFTKRCFEMLFANGITTGHELAIHLGLPIRDIEQVTGVVGCLTKNEPPVSLRMPSKGDDEEPNIIRFPSVQMG